MIASSPQKDWFDAITSQVKPVISDEKNNWLIQTREQARQEVERIDIPSRKQEAWRYSNLDKLYSNTYQVHRVPFTALDVDDIDSWVYPEDESYRLVFANGQCVPALSNIHNLPDAIKLGSLRALLSTDPELVAQWLGQTAKEHNNIFAELNRASIDDGLFLHVPENVKVDKPIEVVYLNLSLEQAALSQPRALVILESGAQAKLIERFQSTGKSEYLFNGVNELYLEANAKLEHYRLQDESPNAHHFSFVAVNQATASEYHAVNLAAGSAWSRTEISTHFSGEHATCELDGLYIVGDNQYTDFHLDIRHNLPNCCSRENFTGIVHGHGHAVFDGRILVEKDAQKTDAQLSNKNLLLVENAEIDTKPQLEIYADDVKCSHGTTVGKIDPNHLFYLRSRGINKEQAYRMLCIGFAEQVLEQVKDAHMQEFIHTHIANIFSQQEVNI